MKRTLLLVVLFIISLLHSYAKEYKLSSPDGTISLNVNVGNEISWSAKIDGREVVSASRIAMILENGKTLGENEKVKKSKVSLLNETIYPVVPNKRSQLLIIVISLNLLLLPASRCNSEHMMMDFLQVCYCF